MRNTPLLLAFVALPLACRPESTGMQQAAQTGDLSHPPAIRVSDANEELNDLCGAPNITHDGEDRLRRQPFLQGTNERSTKVTWTAASSLKGTLVLTDPDGAVVTELAAREEPSGVPDVTQFTADVDDLEPDTVYCYTVNDDGGELIGRVGFRTASPSGPVRFIALGDSGDGGTDQSALLEQLPTVDHDLMLHLGDMAYESGTFEEFQQNYFAVYQDLFRHVAMFPAPGNHEYVTDDALPYRTVFDLPNNERYYSFDRGDVHFVALDTEQVGQKQRQWLEQDLRGTSKRWKIAYLHKPPYSSGEHGSDRDVRDTFGPVFEAHDVDLVLAGHDHHYERMKPQNGVQYLVSGGGGAATYPVSASDFTAFAEEVVHFIYVTIDEGELTLHAIDATGQEFDQLYISK